jgi:hypothetical protein
MAYLGAQEGQVASASKDETTAYQNPDYSRSGCATTGTAVMGRRSSPTLEDDAKAGSAELGEIGAKYPILQRHISDYGKLQDAIRLLHKRRTK